MHNELIMVPLLSFLKIFEFIKFFFYIFLLQEPLMSQLNLKSFSTFTAKPDSVKKATIIIKLKSTIHLVFI